MASRAEWLEHLARTNVSHYERIKEDFERAWFAKFELLLDGAIEGPVWLSDERVALQVAEALHYRHGKVYRLDAFTIMANHVHTVIKPLPSDNEGEYHSLAAIMQSLKGYTAFEGQSSFRSRGRILGA